MMLADRFGYRIFMSDAISSLDKDPMCMTGTNAPIFW